MDNSVIQLVGQCENLAYENKDLARYLENRVLGEPLNEKEMGVPVKEAERHGGLKQELENLKRALEITQKHLNLLINEVDPDRMTACDVPVNATMGRF